MSLSRIAQIVCTRPFLLPSKDMGTRLILYWAGYIYEHLTTSPVASCIILMVHKVKVVNIYIDASASITEIESETDSLPQQ